VGQQIIAFYHEDMKKHYMGKSHLETPVRLDILINSLKQSEFDVKWIKAKQGLEEDVFSVHSKELLKYIKLATEKAPTWITADTRTNKYTYYSAMLAVGASKHAALASFNEKKIAVALTRPPGHHATENAAMGFCFFNNAAVAAKTLLKEKGLNKVLIYDIDNHYGNGTASIFFKTDKVLTTSIHCDPYECYPGVGFPNEIGSGDGIGHNINVPTPVYSNNNDWLYALKSTIIPVIQEYEPEAVIVSAGFDALKGDPYGKLSLNYDAFEYAGKLLVDSLPKKVRKKIVLVIEGGYKLPDLGEAFIYFLRGLTGKGMSLPKQMPVSRIAKKYTSHAQGYIRKYWRI